MDELIRTSVVLTIVILGAMPFGLYVAASFPSRVEIATGFRRRLPVRTVLLGLGDGVAFLGLGATVGRLQPIGGLVVLLVGLLLLAAAVLGLVGTARAIGERLLALGDRPASPLRQLVWGWLLLAGIPLVPLLGVLVLLGLGLGALGSGHLALHARRGRSGET